MMDVFKDNIQIASIGDSSYLYQREGIRICKGKNRVILEKIWQEYRDERILWIVEFHFTLVNSNNNWQ